MLKLKKGIAVGLAICILAVVLPVLAATTDINSIVQTVSETTTTIVDENTVWNYLDDGTDPSANDSDRHSWATVGYDDSAWSSAAGKFGSKNGALSDLGSDGTYVPTVLLNLYINGTAAPTVPAYFFRTSVDLEEDATGIVTGTIYYDDSAIIYINGTKVAAFYADSLTTNLSYGGSNSGTPLKGTFTADATLLKAGKNIIAVEVHNSKNTSSDIWFSATEMVIDPNGEMPKEKNIALTVGVDESERNITWYEPYGESTASVQYAVKNGDAFPSSYTTAEATVASAKDQGYNYCKATLTNLSEDTDYVYRLVNGENVSQVYTFSTANSGSFGFVFVSDPQLGANTTIGANTTAAAATDATAWENTLNLAFEKFPEAHFMISAGDQVNSGANEEQYDYYFSPSILPSITTATVMGNHDSVVNYNQHFNNPNTTSYGMYSGSIGADYWYVYNNVLFMNLNTMNQSTAEHKAFLQEAIDKNPHVLWRVVVFHHSIYSVASHSVDSDIIQRRTELAPVFDELDIDVVLMGHDHTYTRSYMMNGLVPDTTNGVESSVTDPSGILYITANSSTGSKYYPLYNANAAYAAVVEETKVPSYSYVQMTPTSFKITTYRTTDDSVLDDFTINKSSANSLSHNPQLVPAKAATCTQDGNIQYYSCSCGRYYEDAEATTEITDKSSVILEATGHNGLCHVERVPANCTQKGNVEHWYCGDCEGYYKDEAATIKISDIVIESRGGHSGGETYYSDEYHWTLCEYCAEPYNRETHSDDCDCGYTKQP